MSYKYYKIGFKKDLNLCNANYISLSYTFWRQTLIRCCYILHLSNIWNILYWDKS